MSVPAPHFLLFSTARNDRPPHEPASGQWRFVLSASDGSSQLEASDAEPEVSRDRLELLAIVRGLEALDQPSDVTIVTASRYISRCLRFGLPSWRENAWQWERFGQFVPVKNADLWRRIDNAMQFHRVGCRYVATAKPSPQIHVEHKLANNRQRPTPFWTRVRKSLRGLASGIAALVSRPQLQRICS
jgi:ribonuclease HI